MSTPGCLPLMPLELVCVPGLLGLLHSGFKAVFKGIVRLYGFEGEAGWEGAGRTRIRESSYRRTHNQGQSEMVQGQNEIHEIRIHHLGALNEANMKVHALRGAEGDVAT